MSYEPKESKSNRYRRRSSTPLLPDEWLVSLFDYRFYKKGQVVKLPTFDSVVVSCLDGADVSSLGVVLNNTLFDNKGREILPDHVVDWIEQTLSGHEMTLYLSHYLEELRNAFKY